MDESNELITGGTGLILVLSILVVFFFGIAVLRGSNEKQATASAERAVVADYYTYAAYEGRDVSGAEVISLIKDSMGTEISVNVDSVNYNGSIDGSSYFTPLNDLSSNRYELSVLQLAISPLKKYRATLKYTPNGNVSQVQFRGV